MTKLTIRGATDPGLVRLGVIVAGRTHDLKLHIAPGDTAAPALTLMLP